MSGPQSIAGFDSESRSAAEKQSSAEFSTTAALLTSCPDETSSGEVSSGIVNSPSMLLLPVARNCSSRQLELDGGSSERIEETGDELTPTACGESDGGEMEKDDDDDGEAAV